MVFLFSFDFVDDDGVVLVDVFIGDVGGFIFIVVFILGVLVILCIEFFLILVFGGVKRLFFVMDDILIWLIELCF